MAAPEFEDIEFQGPQIGVQAAGRQLRGQQQAQIEALQAEAEGRGVSQQLIGQQARAQQAAGSRQALALAASGRGGTTGLAQRQAAQTQQALAASTAASATQAQREAQLGARAQLTGAQVGVRAADIQAAQAQAALGIQAEQARTGVELGEQQVGAQVFGTAAQQAVSRRKDIFGAIGENLPAGFASLGTGVAQLGTLGSDIRTKSDIRNADEETQEFLDSLSAESFQRGQESVRRVGVMAQDLEKTEAGAPVVVDTPQGKVIDTDELQGVQLAALAQINERLKLIEQSTPEARRRRVEAGSRPEATPESAALLLASPSESEQRLGSSQAAILGRQDVERQQPVDAAQVLAQIQQEEARQRREEQETIATQARPSAALLSQPRPLQEAQTTPFTTIPEEAQSEQARQARLSIQRERERLEAEFLAQLQTQRTATLGSVGVF